MAYMLSYHMEPLDVAIELGEESLRSIRSRQVLAVLHTSASQILRGAGLSSGLPPGEIFESLLPI